MRGDRARRPIDQPRVVHADLGVAGPAGGDGEVGALGVARDPEVRVARVAVNAESAADDRGIGEGGERVAQEVAEGGFLGGGGVARGAGASSMPVP